MRRRQSCAALIPLVAAALAAGGCSVRDEQAVSATENRWWSATPADRGAAGLIAAPPTGPAGAPIIEYVEGFAAGSRRAGDAGLPMLMVFRASWCRWSGELLQATVADPRIVALSRRFVCIAVDADRDAATCRSFEIRAFPAVVLVDAEGRERFRATGSSAAADLAAAMAGGLDRSQPPPRLAGADPDAVR